ncbi:hypothetical protein KKB40_06615 [Patescibacteria group bacterium]|nr:hypothetical protein [Patescibacteria group bacterium]
MFKVRKVKTKSGKKVIEELKTVVDSKVRINQTGEIINARGEVAKKISTILRKLRLSH